jgi:hypothetical protein
MKTVNLGVYDIIKPNEEKPHYDILLCKECSLTCLRCNFSRHKTSPKHMKAVLAKASEAKLQAETQLPS